MNGYLGFEIPNFDCNVWKSTHEISQRLIVNLPQVDRRYRVVRCDWHVAYWAPNSSTSVLNVLIVRGGSWCHHVSLGSFKELGKILHRMTSLLVYKFTCVICDPKCPSRSMVLSYWSMLRGFHPKGKGALRMLSAKGCRRCNQQVDCETPDVIILQCLFDNWCYVMIALSMLQ